MELSEEASTCAPSVSVDDPPPADAGDLDPSDLVPLFKALANETRFAILAYLDAVEEACVCQITPAVGGSQSTVSGHLAKLRDLGIVATRRDGRLVYYAIADPTVELLIECLRNRSR